MITGICYLCLRNPETPSVQYHVGTDKPEEVQVSVKTEKPGEVQNNIQTQKVSVHVCGAVKEPGVYKLSVEARVWEAVNMAGGALQEADADFINQARKILDGERLYIPFLEETEHFSQTQQIAGETLGSEKKININMASEEELETLPGIGKQRAKEIIYYREKNGGFQVIEDIMKVSGIKEAAFEKIRESIITGYEK